MRLELSLVALSVFIVGNAGASSLDSTYGFATAAGFSRPLQAGAFGSFNIMGSVYGNARIVNWAGLSYSQEIRISLYPGTTMKPLNTKGSVYLGHQFRNASGPLYFPIAMGISGSKGAYRGALTGYSSDFNSNPNGPTYEYHERKNFYAPGVFAEVNPSFLIGETAAVGLHFLLDVNTHHFEFARGIEVSFMIP